jgi:hypothetical protein
MGPRAPRGLLSLRMTLLPLAVSVGQAAAQATSAAQAAAGPPLRRDAGGRLALHLYYSYYSSSVPRVAPSARPASVQPPLTTVTSLLRLIPSATTSAARGRPRVLHVSLVAHISYLELLLRLVSGRLMLGGRMRSTSRCGEVLGFFSATAARSSTRACMGMAAAPTASSISSTAATCSHPRGRQDPPRYIPLATRKVVSPTAACPGHGPTPQVGRCGYTTPARRGRGFFLGAPRGPLEAPTSTLRGSVMPT